MSGISQEPSRLKQLEALIQRDQRRKLLVALPTAGLIGLAVSTQATWLLAVIATGMAAAQTLRRPR